MSSPNSYCNSRDSRGCKSCANTGVGKRKSPINGLYRAACRKCTCNSVIFCCTTVLSLVRSVDCDDSCALVERNPSRKSRTILFKHCESLCMTTVMVYCEFKRGDGKRFVGINSNQVVIRRCDSNIPTYASIIDVVS